jgi:hypothetical protein
VLLGVRDRRAALLAEDEPAVAQGGGVLQVVVELTRRALAPRVGADQLGMGVDPDIDRTVAACRGQLEAH